MTDALPFSNPFITIAREPGSGGAPIGQEIAKRLGFTFVDQQIIDEIVKSSKLRKDIVEALDEKGRTAIQDFIHGILNPEYVSDIRYIRSMTKVIASLAYGGNVVILGRGANFLTPRDRGLHVRITAPRPIRIERAIKYEGMSPTQAREVIREVEKDRREFVKHYFGENITQSEHYDIVVNTAHLSVEESAEIIIAAFQRKCQSH